MLDHMSDVLCNLYPQGPFILDKVYCRPSHIQWIRICEGPLYLNPLQQILYVYCRILMFEEKRKAKELPKGLPPKKTFADLP